MYNEILLLGFFMKKNRCFYIKLIMFNEIISLISLNAEIKSFRFNKLKAI